MSALKKMVLLLTAVVVSVPLWAKVELEYFYADDGTLTGRAVNGVRHNFVYDKRGQLLAVKDARGNDIERYVYDPAGNILSKTIGGVTTKYTYDKANQLLTSTRNGKVTKYEYDAAGRLIREGDKVYFYGYQDKILTVTVNGKKKLTFDYHMDGQLASASGNGKSEEFLWDGLALIKRGNTRYVNEPYVTGGNPVIAGNDVMFNDMLGSTVSINDKAVGMTSFGETADSKAMFTGKPYVDGLGYAFLFRNYRTDLGKWQTVDPLGYPDGWNNLAYGNNNTIGSIDCLGGWTYSYVGTWTNDEKSIFESRMQSAFQAISTTARELQSIYDRHTNHTCNCQIHNCTSGILTAINILNASIAKYLNSETLRIMKANLDSTAGAYSDAFLFLSAYMKVNITAGSSYNFFDGHAQSTIRTCIHEISHAGGSDDFLDKNGSPIQRWDNAYIIEDIGLFGIKAFRGIVDLTKCLCE